MEIGAITAPQVWAASARSLTNFGSGALTEGQTALTTLAVNAQVDLRLAATQFGMITFTILTGVGATASCISSLYDGTNAIFLVQTAAAASSSAFAFTTNGSSVGLRLFNNDLTHTGSYMAVQIIMQQ